jgi:signal transduction histidine kinase
VTRRNWGFDVLLAAVLLALGQLEVWAGVGVTHRQGPHWVQATTYGVAAVLLAFRRANPLASLVGVVAVYVVGFALVGSPEGFGVAVPPLVAVYTLARFEEWRRARWGLVGVVVLGVAWSMFDPVNTTLLMHVQSAPWILPWVVAWLVGALARTRAQNVEQRQLRQVERESRAVAEERNRIARELHDVIGHSVSVMTVQASAVRRRLTPDQTVEREALETVEAVGREALTEMRRMVDVLRRDDEATELAPPPGLGEVQRLAEKFRDAGLPVSLQVEGDPRALPPGLDLTAYRLLQEGLTNALKHSVAPSHAEVTIHWNGDRLDLAVRNDGRSVPTATAGGNGLRGMQERVGVYGGQLVARSRPEGGFEMLATLPLEPA